MCLVLFFYMRSLFLTYSISLILFCSGMVFANAEHVPTKKAVAVLSATKGNTVSGLFYFHQFPNHVNVSAHIKGLTPNQQHGVHIHTYGDLTDMESGKSAGGHYNPEGHPHGLPPTLKRHAGSYGNVTANEKGEAFLELKDETITISGFKNPVLGRAVVVHAKPDTGEQPSGSAGPRIGLGVIGLAK
jgi:superoxide dismutase, Cu-Zn family